MAHCTNQGTMIPMQDFMKCTDVKAKTQYCCLMFHWCRITKGRLHKNRASTLQTTFRKNAFESLRCCTKGQLPAIGTRWRAKWVGLKIAGCTWGGRTCSMQGSHREPTCRPAEAKHTILTRSAWSECHDHQWQLSRVSHQWSFKCIGTREQFSKDVPGQWLARAIYWFSFLKWTCISLKVLGQGCNWLFFPFLVPDDSIMVSGVRWMCRRYAA
jgi:hypothetical protein